MSNYITAILCEADAEKRREKLDNLIAENMPSELLILTAISILSDDEAIRRAALERIDERNRAEGNAAARVMLLIGGWTTEGTFAAWPEPMTEVQQARAADIVAAYNVGLPLSSAVRTDAGLPPGPEQAPELAILPDVFYRQFEGWGHETVREIEKLCDSLPILPPDQGARFFEQAARAIDREVKIIERESGRVFESLSGIINASDRHDFTVIYGLSPESSGYGILTLETYDEFIGTLFCVARVSETSFFTHGFTEKEKPAVKELCEHSASRSIGRAMSATTAGGKAGRAASQHRPAVKHWWKLW